MSIQFNKEEHLWYERYRPFKVDDCIAPDEIKDVFKGIVASGKIPTMLLSGDPGMGKTTLALAMCNELKANVMFLNASSEASGVDTFRTTIRQFASTASMFDEQKVIILDEADGLSPAAQLAAKGIFEEFSASCTFILTCNLKAKINDAIQSRSMHIDFKINKDDRPELAKQFFKRVCLMLDNENITYVKPAVIELVMKHFPDFRRTINELQHYAISGTIDAGILLNATDDLVKGLYDGMKVKNFGVVRKLVADNIDIDSNKLYRMLYDKALDYLEPKSVPELILIIADYMYKGAFVQDKEINTVACLTEIMVKCSFK